MELATPHHEWAMLSRVPQLSRVDLSQEDFSLALAAPPDLTRLSISSILAGNSYSLDSFPFVLAADPSGLLLVTDSYGRAKDDPLGADKPIYIVWDPCIVDTHLVPAHQESVSHSGNVGFIVTPSGRRDYDFTVVELLPVTAGESVVILCYDSQSCVWVKKTLQYTMPRYPWSSTNVFSHKNRLWWVDLRHGILSCDPLADDPQVLFVPLPDAAAGNTTPNQFTQERKLRNRAIRYAPTATTPLMRGDISKHRCVSLSADKLRFVEMTGSARLPRVTVWTLADPHAEDDASRWKLDYDVSLKEIIWDDGSCMETGLLNKRPGLAGVHPADPAVVHFLNKGTLFEVNLGAKKAGNRIAVQPVFTDSIQPDIDEESSRFLLTWNLPPLLKSSLERRRGKETSAQTNGERSQRTAALDMLSSFMNLYASAFGKLEYDELARIAIVHLNQKIKKEENKFKLSERHALCSFDEKKDMNSPPKQYAHMNFYVMRYSKAKRIQKLVFAEFVKADVDGDTRFPWTLLSCKTLTKKNHGVLIDLGQKEGALVTFKSYWKVIKSSTKCNLISVSASSSQMRQQENTSPPNKNLTKSMSWYSRLSAEKKEEYLNKQRIARQKKKAAAQELNKVHEPTQLATQGRTPFNDLTNKSVDENRQQHGSNTSWYARLSTDEKENYLMNVRLARQQKSAAAKTPRNVDEPLQDEDQDQPCSRNLMVSFDHTHATAGYGVPPSPTQSIPTENMTQGDLGKQNQPTSQGHCILFKDLANLSNDENLVPQRNSKGSWYARLTAEKKEEHLNKLRIARRQKKSGIDLGQAISGVSPSPEQNSVSPVVA